MQTSPDTRRESYERLINQMPARLKRPSFKELALNKFPFPKSKLFIHVLRWSGMRIGKNVKILGRVKFKIRGKFENIIIHDNVVIAKNVDLRNRENGSIEIKEKAYLDENVRIVAAREGSVVIDKAAEIGANTIINSGGNTYIGEFALLAGFININSSSHGTGKHSYIKDQPHEHGSVYIGNDVWIGSFAAVLMNSSIGEGAIIGSHSVVKGDIPDFGVAVGVPAKVIKSRT